MLAAAQGDPQAVAQIPAMQILAQVPDPVPNFLLSKCDDISALIIRNADDVSRLQDDLVPSRMEFDTSQPMAYYDMPNIRMELEPPLWGSLDGRTYSEIITEEVALGRWEVIDISTPDGIYEFSATFRAEGTTLMIEDIAMYPKGRDVGNLGARSIIQWRNEIAFAARDLGYDTLILRGYRVETGTTAQPHLFDRTIDLTASRYNQ